MAECQSVERTLALALGLTSLRTDEFRQDQFADSQIRHCVDSTSATRRVSRRQRSADDGEREEVGGRDDDRVVDRERAHDLEMQPRHGALEEGHVDPERLVDRPPSQAGDLWLPLVDRARVRLRDVAMACGDLRRAKPVAAEDCRVVQIQQRGAIVEFQRRQRKRQSAAAEQGCRETLAAKPRELLDDRRDGPIGQIEAAIDVGIVVAAAPDLIP